MLVEVRGNNVDRAIRVLKRKLTEDGLWQKLRELQAYEKPSDRARRLKRAAVTRQRKADRARQEVQ